MATPSPAHSVVYAPLFRWQQVSLLLLTLFVGVFGAWTVTRAALLQRPMTDVQVYFRAAWAVRAQPAELYHITDDNRWHYHYPPLFALLLTPLADAPPGQARTGLLPYGVSAALWYVLSIVMLLLAGRQLAQAVEAAVPALRYPLRSQGWWALRLWPLLACVLPIGSNLVRGQVGPLLLLLLAGFVACTMRGHSVRAGLWLAGAICLKVIPGWLLLYPLFRRDLRCLTGTSLGLLVGLVVLPCCTVGPSQTWSYANQWCQVLLKPALGQAEDNSRAEELLTATATASQSTKVLLHNWLNPERNTRPAQVENWVGRTHWLVALGLAGITLWSAGPRQDPLREMLFFGALSLTMLFASPVCHPHYFMQSVLPLTALLALQFRRGVFPWPGWCFVLTSVGFTLVSIFQQFPSYYWLRDFGGIGACGLFLWAYSCWELRRTRCSSNLVTTAKPTAYSLAQAA